MTAAGHPRALLWDVGNVIVRWNPRTLFAKIFREPAELDGFVTSATDRDRELRPESAVEMRRDIEAIDAREEQEATHSADVADGSFDASAI